MNVRESITMAVDAVRAQKLRSSLTLLSIGIGVFAIVASSGITTTLQNVFAATMSDLGENTMLAQCTPSVSFGHGWQKYRKRKNLTYAMSKELRERLLGQAIVSVSNTAPGYTIKAGLESTDPDVSLIGIDDQYFNVNATSVAEGRPFTEQDIILGSNVAIIGNDVKVKLFPNGDAIGQMITIKNRRLKVVGILEVKGALIGQSQDNRVLVPISQFMTYFTWEWGQSVDITIKAPSGEALPAVMDNTIGHLRALRGVRPWEDNDFELDTNDALNAQFGGFTVALSAVAWLSGIGALLAAGIGIMNMMLVSVKERTREIGIRKAVGATRRLVLRQFLIEAVTLCLLGGAIGISSGLLVSWSVSTFLIDTTIAGSGFVAPWFALIFSVLTCSVVGIGFGLYPAWKAATLDPIEALRYE